MDAVLNLGLPAPIDVQVAGSNMDSVLRHGAANWPRRSAAFRGVADVFIPQDIDYPALQLDIDRTRASELGLDQQEVVGQRHHRADFEPDDRAQLLDRSQDRQRLHADRAVSRRARCKTLARSARHSAARRRAIAQPTRLDTISSITRIKSPTEVDHYQLRRTIDIYVRPLDEDLGSIANAIDDIIARHEDAGRRAASRCAAWCRACAPRSAASRSA